MNKFWVWMGKLLRWLGIGVVLLVITVFVLLAINYALPQGWKLEAAIFVTLAGAILSVGFTFLPGLRTAFAGLSSAHKSLVNLILMLVLAVVMFLGTCSDYLPIAGVLCSQEGAKALALYVFLAIAGNQIAYTASPQPVDVREAKSLRSEV